MAAQATSNALAEEEEDQTLKPAPPPRDRTGGRSPPAAAPSTHNLLPCGPEAIHAQPSPDP
ncbi:hypothetical protein T484DRAFT_1800926 [Baffinella frigidus]|nr:hypothetical protein T484DRAFT_1800926 [Cryptophyta sp. CCMP2293]